MAKKQLDEDLLTGGSIKSEKDKAAKSKQNKTKKRVSVSKKTKKIITSVVCCVVIVALLVAYVATGTVRKGFVSYLGIPAKVFTSATVTDGENKASIKVGVYNFYYASTYNNLRNQQEQAQQYVQYGMDLSQLGLDSGLADVDFDKKLSKQTYVDPETEEEMTWEEHMHDLTLDAIKNTYAYYLEAVEANGGEDPEITEEQQTQIDDTLSQYQEQADQYHFTLSAYITAAMGRGVTEELFVRELTRQFIAQNYQSDLQTSNTEAGYDDAKIQEYLDEHEDDFITIDAMIYECASEDEAVEFASRLASDGSNFAELASEYATEDYDKTAYQDPAYSTVIGATKTLIKNRGLAIGVGTTDEETGEETNEALDYLFSSDRQAGEIYQSSTTVVYLLAPASLSERHTVNVRYILILPDESSEASQQTSATTEQWDAAYEKAQSILDEWKSGEATEDSFAQLAQDNSADGSASSGGLIENICTGTMVDSFSTWCFDTSRQAGDTAIVRSDYGYHIMYFVSENDQTVYNYTITQTLASEDTNTQITEIEDAYTITDNFFGKFYNQKDVDFSN
ncbi:MAG: peptidylprolyl isomerase [Eubacterium sp.]|nr:peptidylprolyl isomerase [Eubacterium sp.]